MSAPQLSVVIPAYNESRRLPRTLERIVSYLADQELSGEILVVDDGSSDDTAERAQDVPGPVTVVRGPGNRGKGYAVRRGMLLAQGERRLMTDADLSTPIDELPRLAACLDRGFDVAIGSRALPGANIEVRQPRYREQVGRAFNLAARLLVVPGLHDTQCGFKLFTATAAEAAFRAARLDGFCFDVEALFIARRRGFQVAEIPVTWRNDTASRVTSLRGSLAFLDLLRIRANAWDGVYADRSRAGGLV